MSVVDTIKPLIQGAINKLYKENLEDALLTINNTKPEFEGDYTLVLFSLLKTIKKSPEILGTEIGQELLSSNPHLISSFNVIKGFLNLTISDRYWLTYLHNHYRDKEIGKLESGKNRVVVEYSSPNTNKPLHLGHLRNNFLGWSVAQILEHTGHDVVRTSIVNDRGIHICKSMIAWQKFGNGETPATSGKKGDHLVGEYYVKCENEIKKETAGLEEKEQSGDYNHYTAPDAQKVRELSALMLKFTEEHTDKTDDKIKKLKGDINEIRRANTTIMKEAKQMLLDWEEGKPEVIDLWKTMNSWVYEGFDTTYKRIGSTFDKTYFESETYLPGKKFVEEGLEQGVFFKKDDGSVWIDLTPEGLDEKLVLRKDGTSVYITQDLGLAQEKYDQYKYDQSIYVIADEQNYHMNVLKLILKKLGKPYADGIFHLSYGMVELPSGRMKSREGTVVDADDLIEEMVEVARIKTEELGKVKDFSAEELTELYDTIALGALKFFLLRVDPKKRMVFNPEESIDFHGFTGPFVQYTHARIKSILRKVDRTSVLVDSPTLENESLSKTEKELVIFLEQYELIGEQAVKEHNPSMIAIYIFNLAKAFNSFLAEHPILKAETEAKRELRLQIAQMTGNVIASGLGLLGIRAPERM